MAEGPTMVIVGRADLSLSKGKFAAQAAHAAVKCALTAKRTDPRILDKWNESGARKVICEASNLDALKRLYGEARADGLVAELISDAGHTEIPAGGGVGSPPNDDDSDDDENDDHDIDDAEKTKKRSRTLRRSNHNISHNQDSSLPFRSSFVFLRHAVWHRLPRYGYFSAASSPWITTF